MWANVQLTRDRWKKQKKICLKVSWHILFPHAFSALIIIYWQPICKIFKNVLQCGKRIQKQNVSTHLLFGFRFYNNLNKCYLYFRKWNNSATNVEVQHFMSNVLIHKQNKQPKLTILKIHNNRVIYPLLCFQLWYFNKLNKVTVLFSIS